MDITKQLDIQFSMAEKGRRLWLGLVEDNQLDLQDYVVLFPSDQPNINYYGLLYLNQFINNKRANKTVIVTSDGTVQKAYDYFTDKVTHCYLFNNDDIDSLLNFYRLYMFTNKLIIVSLDNFSGRTLGNLLNIRGITLEEIISLGIYQLREFKQEQPISFLGSNQALKDFFNLS
ncbi:hypothetical protein EHV15_04485 [Paenibacillus oralis]|uniref:Uncharacterized protein n=1 Tax=Paenibacillus oralis TaxID=2490856 RepID=A0A3P3TVW9_9BACL|nr:hypothetical protein [Paenibacillus oralis]RRJ62287.1 hypothetical protein EHV15_04485 [Paenibacillus oralis]